MAAESRRVTERTLSHGRGGAGNIAKSPVLRPTDLETPHIKSSTYTTGRGGTGNMASNDPSNPKLARQAQDVEISASAIREPEADFHYGRGGAANVAKLPKEELEANKARNKVRRESFAAEKEQKKGIAEKGKEMLEKVTGKK